MVEPNPIISAAGRRVVPRVPGSIQVMFLVTFHEWPGFPVHGLSLLIRFARACECNELQQAQRVYCVWPEHV